VIDFAKRQTSPEFQAIMVVRFKLLLLRYVRCKTINEENESVAVIHIGQSENKFTWCIIS
jgi:hypothetical protein